MNIFKKWFKTKSPEQIEPIKDLNIGNIKVYDDVWIKIGDSIFNGWVIGRNLDKITVVYDTIEEPYNYADFTITRPLDRIEITENNITLLLKR